MNANACTEKKPELRSLLESEEEKIKMLIESADVILEKISIIRTNSNPNEKKQESPSDKSTIISLINNNLYSLDNLQGMLNEIRSELIGLVG